MYYLSSFRNLTLALLLFFFPILVLQGQEVELNPGFIDGDVQLGEETINTLRMTASSDLFTAEQNLNPNSVVANYNLTVQVEAGASRDYLVSADIRTDNNRDRLFIRNRSVPVTDGETASQDFIIDPPAYIEGTITVEGGAIQFVSLSASQTATPFDFANTFHQASNGPESLDIRFPVMPGQEVRCSGSVRLTNGVTITLPVLLVEPNITTPVRCDYLIESGPAPGSIGGIIDLDGQETVDRYQFAISGPISLQPVINRPFNTPDGGGNNSHDYSIDLVPGTYSTTASAFLNANDDQVRFPEGAYAPGRTGLEVVSDQETEVFIEACQAYINGSLEFTGSASMEDLIFGQALAQGDPAIDSPTRIGFSFDRMTPNSGEFDLIVTDGDWAVTNFSNLILSRAINDPDGFLNQRINLNIDPAPLELVNLVCGEVIERNFSLPTGSVTFNFTVAGDGVLSNPELRFGFCQKRDDSDQLLYSYSFDAFSQGQVDVPLGTATFEGPAAICQNIRARATVNGTLTTFAEIDDLEILPGVVVVIDIGGPSLEVTFPEPELCIDAEETTVQGIVTDDVDVASVTVNGVSASLVTTNNPDDPVELSFEATIPLVKGPNEIKIIATDGSGKTGQTTFTVFSDAGAPEVSFTPEDGASLSEAAQAIQGSATDDAGIDSIVISLNGSEVATLDGSGALSVDFDEAVTLSPGDNTIRVVATDISEKVTTIEHTVALIDNSPPTVSAGGPYSVDEGGSVQLTATGSDPDEDPLSYAWDLDNDGEFDDATGAEVTFDASDLDGPLDPVTVTVQVSDPDGLTATDSTTVDVKNVAPSTTANVTVPAEPVPVGTIIDVSVPFTDPGVADTHTVVWHWGDGSESPGTASEGTATATHSYSEQGFYRISCTITDDDGAPSTSCQAAADVTVIDPDDGFVTGGGWIESPAGAYRPDPSLTGKASFGFAAKYPKDALEPKENVEFQFKAGDLNFHASSYQWLVIVGAQAQFRGRGTINQSGQYEFMLTAIDGRLAGGEDKFRIQIWDDQGTLVYDNLPGGGNGAVAINRGSIVIHTKGNK